MSKVFDNGVTPLKIVMDDGEPIENTPVNPLLEKWEKAGYTKDIHGRECKETLGHYEDGRPIPNYGCVLCHSKNCYHSDSWKVPEEDKEVYEEWRRAVDEFYKLHSPEFYKRYMEEK